MKFFKSKSVYVEIDGEFVLVDKETGEILNEEEERNKPSNICEWLGITDDHYASDRFERRAKKLGESIVKFWIFSIPILIIIYFFFSNFFSKLLYWHST